MALDKSFIQNLPTNPLLGETKIIEEFRKILEESNKKSTRETYYDDFLDLFSLYQVYAAKHSLDILFPPLTNDKKINTGIIINFFETRQKEINEQLEDVLSLKTLAEKKSTFETILSQDITYNLTDKDLNTLYHKLDLIIDAVNENFDVKRSLKSRLINLLGILKRDLKPTMQNFDKFWALVGYTGILYGLYEDKVMKILDKIKDVLNFVWKIQAKAEGLPSTNPVITVIFKEIHNK
ncbi:MAG: 3-hydroxyacyl-CoA dehydrogenase NAD-binding domain-containing protein [Ignavibacteria bacterium]|nr:3-hydroxyacyl-CoA dehydrogenase NAD-binding domain-containing protein [Ignavibacteria bacterium]